MTGTIISHKPKTGKTLAIRCSLAGMKTGSNCAKSSAETFPKGVRRKRPSASAIQGREKI